LPVTATLQQITGDIACNSYFTADNTSYGNTGEGLHECSVVLEYAVQTAEII
jgi:hypothetical protein